MLKALPAILEGLHQLQDERMVLSAMARWVLVNICESWNYMYFTEGDSHHLKNLLLYRERLA